MAATAQKVALVTAGSAGLGAQIARVLAPDFRVVINYANNGERAAGLVRELEGIGGSGGGSGGGDVEEAGKEKFLAVQADVGVKSEVQRLVRETVERMGRLDVVVSNAGWTRMTDFANLDDGAVDDDWDRCFTYNVKTHLWLMHAAKPFLEKTEGAFVSTASLAGVKPSGSSLPYAVTKAAQIHLAKSLAVICAPKIRVNSVSPGMLLTEWGLKFPTSKREATIAKTQLGRLATVEDVALNVRTLALSKSQTGQNIVLDCGSSL